MKFHIGLIVVLLLMISCSEPEVPKQKVKKNNNVTSSETLNDSQSVNDTQDIDVESTHTAPKLVKKTVVYDQKKLPPDLAIKKSIFYVDSQGRKQGECKHYTAEGKIYQLINYTDDIYNGDFIAYRADGLVFYLHKFDMGRLMERRQYHQTGELQDIGYYNKDPEVDHQQVKQISFAAYNMLNYGAKENYLLKVGETYYPNGIKDYSFTKYQKHEEIYSIYKNDKPYIELSDENGIFSYGSIFTESGERIDYEDETKFYDAANHIKTKIDMIKEKFLKKKDETFS